MINRDIRTRSGTWTRTPIQAQDFKSGVSTNSTIRATPDWTVGLQSFFRTFVVWRARNGIRTRDPDLGKVVLYQLSYSRL